MGFFSEYGAVRKFLSGTHDVVFYAESRHYYPYYRRLIDDLLENTAASIKYVTSDREDPVLQKSTTRWQSLYSRSTVGFLFSRMKAKMMVMTMPGLGDRVFRKSPAVGNYVYVFHALVSTHQQYKRDAFAEYDTIFCTGPYQEAELRDEEARSRAKPRRLVPYGYPLVDDLSGGKAPELSTILVAPSWFRGCIFDTCIEQLIDQLSSSPYRVILRSHPEYEKRHRSSFRKIQQIAALHPRMEIDQTADVDVRLRETDLLITDRSGIAFEFALGRQKPVLFIDTVLKEMNPSWRERGIEPIENSQRGQLGVSMSPGELSYLQEKINETNAMDNAAFRERMIKLKSTLLYNSPQSYEAGWKFIHDQLQGH